MSVNEQPVPLAIFALVVMGWTWGGGAGCAALGALPVVVAEVRVEAAAFNQFTAKQKTEVQSEASQKLAEKCRTYFPFLRWRAFTDGGAPEDASAVLTLVVQEDQDPPRGYELAPPIWITYAGRVGQQTTSLPEVNARLKDKAWRTLYEFGIVDTHDTRELKGKLAEAIARHFDSDRENFRKVLETEFLRLIPLVNHIDVERPPAGVVIPIAERELRAKNDTRLRFEFESPFPLDSADSFLPGHMELVKQGGFPVGELQREVYCHVNKIQHGPFVDAHDQPRIRDLVRLARHSSRQVFMWAYELDTTTPSTADGVIIDLD